MLFRKHIVSTRALFQLTVAVVFILASVGAAVAANSGNPPLLVPYTINTVAGNPLRNAAGGLLSGYGGDGGPAVPFASLTSGGPVLNSLSVQPGQSTANVIVTPGATLSGPESVAVDSVGNIYFTDTSNDVVREVNAQTGTINTIAGVDPQGCSGILCSGHTVGCSDGVLAYGGKVGGGLAGIAVDAYGNVYFDDSNSATVSVIYRGGTRVADFIQRVNPAAVTASGGTVKVGYLYLIAGTVSESSCKGSSTPAVDGALAFENLDSPGAVPGANLFTPTLLSLDSAGNIYIADKGNATVRVINTQETAQTFFQYTVQPGYMQSILNCNPVLTIPCPAITTNVVGTGINGPANGVVKNSQFMSGQADAYGNVYETDGSGGGTAAPGVDGMVAYAGGSPLTSLLTVEAPMLSSTYSLSQTVAVVPPGDQPTPNELPLAYGNAYLVVDNPSATGQLEANIPNVFAVYGNNDLAIRPVSLLPDVFGTLWFMDGHYPELERIDQYTSDATDIIGSVHERAIASNVGINNGSSPATFTNPWYCVYGVKGHPWVLGPQTFNPLGDGCPAILGVLNVPYGGTANTVGDGLGNIYIDDRSDMVIREIEVGTQFPAMPLAQGLTQPIQVHFDESNPPSIGPLLRIGTNSVSTTAFSIAPGNTDFKIDTTDPEFAMGTLGVGALGNNSTTGGNWGMYAGLPSCAQLGATSSFNGVADTSYDCLVYVTFKPTQPGLRTTQLVATTANGSVYNFQLTGIGTGGQLAIDGGQQATVAVTGLGTTAGVAVDSTGTLYIADPSNNQIVVKLAGGVQTTIGTGLSGPMGVAVDAANNVYIADTGNNRIVEVNPVSNTQTVLGNYLWIPGAGNTPPPQYQFKAPQGIAVDAQGNVYVADTGNSAVVEIPSNTALGGAVQLLQYAGAPKFIQPVAVAVDSHGFIYVADQQNPAGQVVVIPPGGGDLQPATGNPESALFINLPIAGGYGINEPNGVAVDAAGDVYISDGSGNAVWEAPAAGAATSKPYVLSISGLSTPAGLALDSSGNLYVADSGNKQVVFENRQNPVVSYGDVPMDLPAGTEPLCANTQLNDGFNTGYSAPGCPLTVTNIGNQPITLASPFLVTSVNPSYTVTSSAQSGGPCPSPMPVGSTCTITPLFLPTSDSGTTNSTATITVNGTQSVALTADGESPQAMIVLSSSTGTGTPPKLTIATGSTPVITATVTSHTAGVIPTGTVTFSYAIDAGTLGAGQCGAPGSATVNLVNGVATYPLPTVTQGQIYTVNATYNAVDTATATDSGVTAVPLVLTDPGITETVTATSVTYQYGTAVPAFTGTVVPVPPSPITYSFSSGASQYSPVDSSPYPIQVNFSPYPAACAYGFPPATNSGAGGGTAAQVTETPAPLAVTVPAYTTVYGAASFNFASGMVITGAVGDDLPKISASFTPPDSSILDVNPAAPAVNPYPVIATMTGKPILAGDYTVTPNPPTGSDQVTPAPSSIGVTPSPYTNANTAAGVGAATEVQATAGASSATYTILASTLVTAGKGIPTGTITVYDNFVPITSNSFIPVPSSGAFPTVGSVVKWPSTVFPPCSATVTSNCTTPQTVSLVGGVATFSLPSADALNNTPGTHYLSFMYSGDAGTNGDGLGDFACSVVGQPAGANGAPTTCPSTGATPFALIVDNPDFTLTSNTGPVAVIPGVVPSGNGLPTLPNQNTAALESAVLQIAAILNFSGTVNLTCTPQAPAPQGYETCSVGEFLVVGNAAQIVPYATVAENSTTSAIFTIQTPATLPLGFTTSRLRTSATRTVLAFLPFGVLAFCVRRRRRLSKALWMLIAIASVSVGMSGCGGNTVDFYTPVPTGAQAVTVTASYTPTGASTPTLTRTFSVPILID